MATLSPTCNLRKETNTRKEWLSLLSEEIAEEIKQEVIRDRRSFEVWLSVDVNRAFYYFIDSAFSWQNTKRGRSFWSKVANMEQPYDIPGIFREESLPTLSTIPLSQAEDKEANILSI